MEPEPVAADLGDDTMHDTHKRRQWEAAPRSAPHAPRVESDFLKNPKQTTRSLRSIDPGNGGVTHFGHSEDEVHGWMLRVDAFQLHPLLEAILHRWHPLGLNTFEKKGGKYFNADGRD